MVIDVYSKQLIEINFVNFRSEVQNTIWDFFENNL